jgi:prepilin-type N-terminal cleavage/methylation domain-containing protein
MPIRRKVKKSLTLIELLIVIALIGIIGSALAYNLGAGLNKGREFRNEQTKLKIKNILDYEIFNNNRDPHEASSHWKEWVAESSLVNRDQKIEELYKDGYGGEFIISYDDKTEQLIVLSSKDKAR